MKKEDADDIFDAILHVLAPPKATIFSIGVARCPGCDERRRVVLDPERPFPTHCGDDPIEWVDGDEI